MRGLITKIKRWGHGWRASITSVLLFVIGGRLFESLSAIGSGNGIVLDTVRFCLMGACLVLPFSVILWGRIKLTVDFRQSRFGRTLLILIPGKAIRTIAALCCLTGLFVPLKLIADRSAALRSHDNQTVIEARPEMILLPPPDFYTNEVGPIKEKTFAISRTAVTRDQFRAVSGELGRNVESVSQVDRIRYCNRLSTLEELTPCYDESGTPVEECTGYRLPTDEETGYADQMREATPMWSNDADAASDALGFRVVVTHEKQAKMVLIPAGEFQMGSNDGEDNEKPVHTVYLDAFYIDKYEVTNAQYRRFVQATGHREPKGYGYVDGKFQADFEPWKDAQFNGDNQPVVCVSWHDAAAYAQWAGKRLPTEAEWEKAARGGLVGKKYPWGDSIDKSQANYGSSGTQPVGSYPPNDYGLYDMAGNVWEWCMDEWDSGYYAKSPRNNPVAGGLIFFVNNDFTIVKNSRVVRGGSWYTNPDNLRVAVRNGNDPAFTGSSFGFRCAGP